MPSARRKRDRVEEARAFYARLVATKGGAIADRLEVAFARVPRERFLGRPPWYAVTDSGYVRVPGDDPAYVYQNLLFALNRAKGINNGEPMLHGQLIGALAPAVGECVIHVGCGTGYYTAILAELVGPTGRVVAYEIEPELAARAAEYLAPWTWVEVIAGSAAEGAELPRADAIYVNAGATRPLACWLDALKEGGRLVFPLVSDQGWGVTLKVTATGGDVLEAEVLNRVCFIGCAGASDPEEGEAVARASRSGALLAARALHRGGEPDDSAVLVGDGWWLSSEPPAPGEAAASA